MKKLFIIGAGEMQVPIIKKAKEMGVFCIVSDFDPKAPGFELADLKLNISTLDFENTLTAAIQFKADGILTTSDYPVRTVAYVCEKIGLKGLSRYSAEACTNKYLQRTSVSASGIHMPKCYSLSSAEEINNYLNDLVFPLIVKPIDSSASRGVSKAINKEEFFTAFHHALNYSVEKKVIVEEFVEGPEYSVESLTQNGETHTIAITQKSTHGSDNRYFVESRHIVPADITATQEGEIQLYAKKVIEALKIDNCATHLEIKLSSKGPVMIEIGARLGGDYITSDLVPLATGVDMLKNVIKIALNEKIDVRKKKSQFSGIEFVTSENYNDAKRFILENKMSVIKYDLKPYKENPVTNSLDRLGYIIVTSDNRESLVQQLALNSVIK
ncbi:MAG: ATP-grasp domain-containing protein [Prolixibacteraceae bacterium]